MSDKFGQVWTSLDKFGQVWTSLDKFEQVQTSLDKVGQFNLIKFQQHDSNFRSKLKIAQK